MGQQSVGVYRRDAALMGQVLKGRQTASRRLKSLEVVNSL